jgi:hypothetical protein
VISTGQNNSGSSSNSGSSNESEEGSGSDAGDDSDAADDADDDTTAEDDADDASAGDGSGESGYCPAEDASCGGGGGSSFRTLPSLDDWALVLEAERTRSTLYANGENTGGAATRDPRTSPFEESDVVNPYINPGDSDTSGTDWGMATGSGLVVEPQKTVGQTLDPRVESGIIDAVLEDLFNDDLGALGGTSPKASRSLP